MKTNTLFVIIYLIVSIQMISFSNEVSIKASSKLHSRKINKSILSDDVINNQTETFDDAVEHFNKAIKDIKEKLTKLEEDKEKIDEADFTLMKNNTKKY